MQSVWTCSCCCLAMSFCRAASSRLIAASLAAMARASNRDALSSSVSSFSAGFFFCCSNQGNDSQMLGRQHRQKIQSLSQDSVLPLLPSLIARNMKSGKCRTQQVIIARPIALCLLARQGLHIRNAMMKLQASCCVPGQRASPD